MLQKITSALRDEEYKLRVKADQWAKAGAHETARACAEKANTLDHAVQVVLSVASEQPDPMEVAP